MSKEVKQRYWKKKAENAPMIYCECGCGNEVKSIDDYGRPRKYINGHNAQIYPHETANSHTAATKRWIKRNRKRHQNARNLRRRNRKIELIKIMGSKCLECGMDYNGKNGTNFEFHHVDPKEKDGSVTGMMEKSLDNLLKEIQKCVLLCAHCHNIHHNGEW